MSEEKVLELLCDFANAIEAAVVGMKHRIAELTGVEGAVAVPEETFNVLKWEKATGNRIGQFETTTKKNNIPDKFQQAFNILKKNNATISNRYHGDNYLFSYWLYADKIYRQKLKRN